MHRKLISEHWTYKQTDVWIKTDEERAIEAVKNSIIHHRNELERYIVRNLDFGASLVPVDVEDNAPKVIKLMVEASKVARVGPMAAVAGTLAQLAVEDALSTGVKNLLVDNGGDIFIYGNQNFRAGIHAGSSPLSDKLAFEIEKERLPISICTSSATVGPSISFGGADAATILASSGALADAAATSVCNETRGTPEDAIKAGLNRAREIPGIDAALIIHGKFTGSWGRLPKLLLVEK
jgi:hypothetical protein